MSDDLLARWPQDMRNLIASTRQVFGVLDMSEALAASGDPSLGGIRRMVVFAKWSRAPDSRRYLVRRLGLMAIGEGGTGLSLTPSCYTGHTINLERVEVVLVDARDAQSWKPTHDFVILYDPHKLMHACRPQWWAHLAHVETEREELRRLRDGGVRGTGEQD